MIEMKASHVFFRAPSFYPGYGAGAPSEISG